MCTVHACDVHTYIRTYGTMVNTRVESLTKTKYKERVNIGILKQKKKPKAKSSYKKSVVMWIFWFNKK